MFNPIFPADKIIDRGQRYVFFAGNEKVKADFMELLLARRFCAPILGLSDVIVDIVETGTTLKENNLKVLTEFMPISARFISNRVSYQFKHQEIETMLQKLTEVTGQ